MIKAIFFSKFDIYEGPKVVHQVPNDSIVPSPTSPNQSLIHFPSIAHTIIPKQSFCSLPITLLHSRYRILSHPVCLTSPTYPRNEFIFNFSLVLSRHTDPTAYASVAAKLAALFKHLEESSAFLSRDQSSPNTGKIYALCEILLEDLNNYCECMIPIDEDNTLNIKLFPTYPNPAPVFPHHVPLSTVQLESLKDPNWDLTMLRILEYIDGVNSVKQIALLADADYKLVRKAVEHLLYYGCIMLLDVFNFGASYAATAEMGAYVADHEVQEEGRRYVLVPEIGLGEQKQWGGEGEGNIDSQRKAITGTKLVELYCSLRQDQSLRSWCIEHIDVVRVIDVRRFITFGVIKGFLYRVHKYALAIPPSTLMNGNGPVHKSEKTIEPEEGDLATFLDGTHCFDEICTELMISEKELLLRLKSSGDVQIIHR